MNSNQFYNRDFGHFDINPYWNKYDNLLQSLSNEQKLFVNKQEKVINAKNILLGAFMDYLFERYKNSFVAESETARQLSDEYFNCVKAAADSFVTRSEQLEKENAELKKQLQQFMKREEKNENRKQTK